MPVILVAPPGEHQCADKKARYTARVQGDCDEKKAVTNRDYLLWAARSFLAALVPIKLSEGIGIQENGEMGVDPLWNHR